MDRDEIRFSFRTQFRDGCAMSFTSPTRVIYAWGQVTLLIWDDEQAAYVFSEVFDSWELFAASYLPDALRTDDPTSFQGRTLVLDEVN